MAANGTYANPATRSCFVPCASCSRCEKRGTSACPMRNTCSGRPDLEGKRDPHPDDYCQCKEGILRWVTKPGRLVIRKFNHNPFKGDVKMDKASDDEVDWNMYLQSQREKLDMEDWDPVTFEDGSSTSNWIDDARRGKRVW